MIRYQMAIMGHSAAITAILDLAIGTERSLCLISGIEWSNWVFNKAQGGHNGPSVSMTTHLGHIMGIGRPVGPYIGHRVVKLGLIRDTRQLAWILQ